MSIIDDIGRQQISLDQGYVDLSGDINSRVNQAEKILGPLEAQTEILKKLSALLDVVDEELYEYPESGIAFHEWIKQGLALVDQIGLPTDRQELVRIFTQFFGAPPPDFVAPDAPTTPDFTEEDQEVPAPEVEGEAAPITPEGNLIESVASPPRKTRNTGVPRNPGLLNVKMKGAGKPRREAAPEATPVDIKRAPKLYTPPRQGAAVLRRAFTQPELPDSLEAVLAIGDPDWSIRRIHSKGLGLNRHISYAEDLARGRDSNIRQQVKDTILTVQSAEDGTLTPEAAELLRLMLAHPASMKRLSDTFQQWGLDL